MGDRADRIVRLGPGAEFDRIRRFIDRSPPMPASVRVGPGDDGAVLEGGWVLSTDMSVEDVHFRRAWLSDQEIGYRAAAAAFSDLAAMAAEPTGLLLSIASGDMVDLDAVHAGVLEAATSVGAVSLGGDLSGSPGPLVIDLTVVGCTQWPVLRDGAEPGDDVWVTGRLGASAAALDAWEHGREPAPAARSAFARPTPRIQEACCLAEEGIVDALIDISDGLAGDAGHIAAASGVRITLDARALPLAPVAVELLGWEGALEAAVGGGEDYELCFVADPGAVDPAGFEKRFGIPVTRVGTVAEGDGVWLDDGVGEVVRLEGGGFDHFRRNPE